MTDERDVTPRCEDCQRVSIEDHPLQIVAADLGQGALLAILCEQCWHRRKYRAKLRKSLDFLHTAPQGGGGSDRASASSSNKRQFPPVRENPESLPPWEGVSEDSRLELSE